MKALIGAIASLFRRHKLKMLCVPLFAVAWGLLIFPKGDLADLFSAKSSELSGGAVYLDMDSFGISLFPSPEAILENVAIDARMLPTIKLKSLTASASIASLLAGKLGVSAHAGGLFNGDADVTYAQGEKTASGNRLQSVDLRLDRIGLGGLNEVLRALMPMDLSLRGSVNGTARASVDPGFGQQPTGAFDVEISKLSMNLVNLLGIELAFEKTQLVGRLSEGKLQIEKGDLGSVKDDLNAKIKGSVDLAVLPAGPGAGSPRLEPGAFDLVVSLNATDAIVRRLGLIFDSITQQGGKSEKTATGYAYRFRAVPGPGGLPRYMSVE